MTAMTVFGQLWLCGRRSRSWSWVSAARAYLLLEAAGFGDVSEVCALLLEVEGAALTSYLSRNVVLSGGARLGGRCSDQGSDQIEGGAQWLDKSVSIPLSIVYHVSSMFLTPSCLHGQLSYHFKKINNIATPIMVTEAEDSFQTRVKDVVNGKYLPCMRRSMQSLALYEANRCLTTRYDQLRPFQRKYALSATAIDLLGTLDFLNDFHCQEIMFRTNASKDPLQPDLAWRRMKLISRELNQIILPKAKELIEKEWNRDKSHDEICEMLLQSMYEDSTENTKPHPPMWEFNHNNAFTVYRVYYHGIGPDPNIFAPISPRLVDVPLTKPAGGWGTRGASNNASGIDGDTLALANMTINAGKRRNNNASSSDEERRAMLKEVKDHTELLKEFEGVIPEEELAERKRALYAALPPVPAPATTGGGGGKGRRQNKKKAKVEAPVAMEEEEGEWEKVPADDNHEEAVKDLAADGHHEEAIPDLSADDNHEEAIKDLAEV